MKYLIDKEKITILDNDEFNSKHILECGQIFRYKLLENGDYEVLSGDKKAIIKFDGKRYYIYSNDLPYFENFFDLKNDYRGIKEKLANQSETMKLATEYGAGIRILNQQPIEVIFSFIISANNNIKRIQGLVEKLSKKVGTDMGAYYAFPTLEQISTLSIDDLKALGMGFRAPYIFNTAKALKNVDIDGLKNKSTVEKLDFLKTLCGVGPKVADCIALFAYHDMNCFPVDTWVEKIHNQYFSPIQEHNRTKIRGNLVKTFGNLSGYAQQYLFYYKRELDRNIKS